MEGLGLQDMQSMLQSMAVSIDHMNVLTSSSHARSLQIQQSRGEVGASGEVFQLEELQLPDLLEGPVEHLLLEIKGWDIGHPEVCYLRCPSWFREGLVQGHQDHLKPQVQLHMKRVGTWPFGPKGVCRKHRSGTGTSQVPILILPRTSHKNPQVETSWCVRLVFL